MADAYVDKVRDKILKMTPEQQEKFKIMFKEEWDAYESSRPVNKKLAEFITTYPAMIQLKERIKILSDVDDPVLITGPTGTGKELLARALHGEREGKFVDINCAGLPDQLIESELFGYAKGAFTGANSDKVGLLQTAHNGTVFLDEIGELPMSAQAKLLRAIQEKEIRRVGDDKPIGLHCRFVCATHRNLREEIVSGRFREDLYWRISIFEEHIEGLAGRTADVKPIVKKIIISDKTNHKYDLSERLDEFCKIVTEEGRNKLTGNVRQLQKLVRNYHVFGTMPEFV